jgi:integrase
MKIELRTRKHPSGNRSLYLEYYEKGGKRKTESLNLFLIPERNDNDREVNQGALNKALKIKAERILGIEREPEEDREEQAPSRIFAEWMDEYEVHLRDAGKVTEAYCKTMHSTIGVIKSYLRYSRRPRMLMEKIDKSFYMGFLAYMKGKYKNRKSPENPVPLSEKTMLLIQGNLNSMLNYAVRKGALKKNPFYELDLKEKIHKTPSNREYLTVDEVKALAGASTGSPITKQTFLFCCFTGLRHSDMAALRWQDIQKTDAGEIINLPSMQKTKHPVIIPLGIQAKSWLPERNNAEPDAKVFPDAPTIGCADRALKHMAKRAGIDKTISFHCSRHTFATLALTAGGDIFTTSKILGHTNVHTTEIYAGVVNEKKRAAVTLVDSVFR